MLKKLLFTVTLLFLFLNFFAQNKDQISKQELSFDLEPYLFKLDSLGVNLNNDTLLLSIGYQNIYYGKNDRGNALMTYALSKRKEVSAEDYHSLSVQNTKNGNYSIAIAALEKAMELDPKEISPYYGWVLLYYYRDYEKSLKILEQYDAYTPNFSDAPMGEDIHYLKGLAHMQLEHYQIAVDEFNIYITNLASTHGEDFVDVYTFVQKGRCLSKLKKYNLAIAAYKKAIKYHENCSESYYFMGLTQLQMKQKDKACKNFNIALTMINKGHKSSDNYVEYFHEIYPQQIEKAIAKNCNSKL